MIQGSLSRRYATALLALSANPKQHEELRGEIAIFSALLREHTVLFDTFCNQTLLVEERKKVLVQIMEKLNLSELAQNFLLLLLSKQRFNLIHEISHQFGELADQQSGILRARLTAAQPLDGNIQKEISAELSRLTGKQIDLNVQVDPSVIGGLATHIGYTVFDGTVATQLEKLKEQMLRQKLQG